MIVPNGVLVLAQKQICAPSKHTREIHFKNPVENNNTQEGLNGEF